MDKIGCGSAMTTNRFDCRCAHLALSLYAFSLDIARYAFGKVRINLLAINTEISTKSNDRFGLKESISMSIVN